MESEIRDCIDMIYFRRYLESLRLCFCYSARGYSTWNEDEGIRDRE